MPSLSSARYVYTESFLEIKTTLVVQIEREVGEAGSAVIGREAPELCDQRCFRVSTVARPTGLNQLKMHTISFQL